MYMWDQDDFRPPQDILDKCVRIHIGDQKHRSADMIRWAKLNCKSFVWCEVKDVSDVSMTMDEVAELYFSDPVDVTMFELKFR